MIFPNAIKSNILDFTPHHPGFYLIGMLAIKEHESYLVSFPLAPGRRSGRNRCSKNI